MHQYQMEIKRWFGGYVPFVIEAESKTDALAKAKVYVCQNPPYCWGDYDRSDVRCVKKLKPKGK
jgi:hypothetical protein